MSSQHYGGNTIPEITKEEHQGDMNAKRVFDVVANSLVPTSYDYISQTVGATSKTFVFRSGGVSGTVVSTIVLQYTDSSLEVLSSVTKT